MLLFTFLAPLEALDILECLETTDLDTDLDADLDADLDPVLLDPARDLDPDYELRHLLSRLGFALLTLAGLGISVCTPIFLNVPKGPVELNDLAFDLLLSRLSVPNLAEPSQPRGVGAIARDPLNRNEELIESRFLPICLLVEERLDFFLKFTIRGNNSTD